MGKNIGVTPICSYCETEKRTMNLITSYISYIEKAKSNMQYV